MAVYKVKSYGGFWWHPSDEGWACEIEGATLTMVDSLLGMKVSIVIWDEEENALAKIEIDR